MAGRTQEDAFHEIQLNGKQLVFLFMAATVVSVVIFLCGVLVGRGVRSARVAAEETVALNEGPTASALPATSTSDVLPEPVVAAGSDPRAAEAPPEVDDLTFFSRLEEATPAAEELKPAKPAPAAAPKPVPTAAPKPPQTATAKSAPAPAASPAGAPAASSPSVPAAPKPVPAPAAGDWAVQIAALNVQSEAEAVAKRLAAKGYTAYVVTPGNGTPAVYRVRIGPFKTRGEADTVAVKLEKEEQFKPWVTR